MDEVISFSNVRACAGERVILDGFDLALSKGSLRVLLGPSGTGKTTLFRLLTDELQPSSGTIHVGESEAGSLGRPKLRRSIGVVFQDVPLLNDRNTEEQILLPLELLAASRKRRRTVLENVLDRFELHQVRRQYPCELSMGMRQRIAIARAVAAEPLVLLADEPAAHLDSVVQQEIAAIFQRENLRGMTILIGTSDEHFASLFPAACVQLFRGGLVKKN